MSVSRFVRGSSLVIATWLVITFLSDVPVKGYPKLDRKPATVALDPVAPDLRSQETAAQVR